MIELAIHGGKPTRETSIYYGRQCIDDTDIQAVIDTLRSDLITQGPKTAEFERAFCESTGAKYAVVLANGTAALHLACLSIDVCEGKEVITSPMTFAASANCVLYCGGKPVFADINPHTYNISPKSIRERITAKTKAIIAVDFTGQAAQLSEITEICQEYGLTLIEDAAHSIGTKYNGVPVGSIADMTTFSFHPVKTITGGEGGAVTTNNESLYNKLKLLRTHGITRDEGMMENVRQGTWYYEQLALGYNYRITDFQSSLLISQLRKLRVFTKRRKEIAAQYNSAFSEMPEIILQSEIPQSDTTPHLYIIQLDLDKLRVGRKEVFDALVAENIVPTVHYIPVYYFPYYQRLGYKRGLCPNAERLYERILSLPIYYSLTDEDVNDVIKAVKKVIDYYKI